MRVSFIIPGRPQRWQRPKEDSRKGKKTHRFIDKRVEAAAKVIRQEAALQWRSRPPHTGPVVIRVLAVFRIPSSWPKALRDLALDGKVWHISDPDFDQIVKLIMDAIRGLIYVDDNQVVGFLDGSAKRYGDPERTEIDIVALPQQEGAVTPGQQRIEREQRDEADLLASGKLGRRVVSTNMNKRPSRTTIVRGFKRRRA